MASYSIFPSRLVAGAMLLATSLSGVAAPPSSTAQKPAQQASQNAQSVDLGRQIYMQGRLPSGELMTGVVGANVKLSGDQVVCGACHRRSGIGSSEGQDVVPSVVGDILFNPLRLPTSKPPLSPEQRPAYTNETLKRAIRDGIGAKGETFSPLMPRYPLNDQETDLLVGYLKRLSVGPDPGVTEREIHFSTIVSDAVDPAARKAFLDVLQTFVEQKNVETRNESSRADNAPWHKEWVFGPYRKWVLHVWELKGDPDSWPGQLADLYTQQPVFAMLSGIAPGSWKPIHDFCEGAQIPCLFPITDLPVVNERDFYTLYLSKGMTLEGEAVAQHLTNEGLADRGVLQIYQSGDTQAETAAWALGRTFLAQGKRADDVTLEGDQTPTAAEHWAQMSGKVAVLWLNGDTLAPLWASMAEGGGPERVYLSTTLYTSALDDIPAAVRDRVLFVHPYELAPGVDRLLMRSTGWFRAKRIHAPAHKRIQADAYLTLKVAGGALQVTRGYFLRDYFLERIEHMIDNAPYTSVYPRIRLAPGQRFVSKGAYIAKLADDGSDRLVAVTDWLIPRSN